MNDGLDAVRNAQDRPFELAGVPMILTLEAADAIPATAPPLRADGARLADRIEALRDEIAAGQRSGDEGITISLVQAVAFAEFGPDQGVGMPPVTASVSPLT